jgi:hypothetical protein
LGLLLPQSQAFGDPIKSFAQRPAQQAHARAAKRYLNASAVPVFLYTLVHDVLVSPSPLPAFWLG